MRMQGKAALVTGAASGIGKAIAEAFTREGAELILTYQGERQKQTVEELAADLRVRQVLPCDVTQDDQLASLTSEIAREVNGTVCSRPFFARAAGSVHTSLPRSSSRFVMPTISPRRWPVASCSRNAGSLRAFASAARRATTSA